MLVKVAALCYSHFASDVAAVETLCARRPCMQNLNCGRKARTNSTYMCSRMQVWVIVALMALKCSPQMLLWGSTGQELWTVVNAA